VQELRGFHEPRIEALLEAGPDLLAIETIPSILEAEALVTILDGLPDVPAWISFSCSDGVRISDGTPFTDAAALAAGSRRVVAVGVNCSPPIHVPALLSSARVDTPLLAYPNLGSTWDAAAKSWVLRGPRPDLGAAAAAWRGAGARIVGGCCGTTPGDIRAIGAGR
jgi:homocysteine S-methyltransferase